MEALPQGLQGQLLVGNPIFFCCRRHMSFKIVQDSWLKKKSPQPSAAVLRPFSGLYSSNSRMY